MNHFYSDLSPLKNAIETKSPKKVDSFDASWGRHKLALFKYFQKMVPVLCESLSDYTVVLRPHPAENHAPWLAHTDRCPNLHIANDGSIAPWLMATKAVIANSCTTQVEAAVLDTPSISYMPVASEKFDHRLPNVLSHQVDSVEDLCDTVRSVMAGKLGALNQNVRRKLLNPHLASLEGPLAADRMVDVLKEGGYNDRKPPATPFGKYAHGWIHNRLRTIVKHINMRRPGHRNNLAYHTHRWPHISVDDVKERVSRLGRLLNRFDGIKVEACSKHIFRISS